MQETVRPTPGSRVETRLAVLGPGAPGPGSRSTSRSSRRRTSAPRRPGSAGREYSRDDGTPGWEAFEELIGDLEGGRAVASPPGWLRSPPSWSCCRSAPASSRRRDSYTGLRGLLADGRRPGPLAVAIVDIADADGPRRRGRATRTWCGWRPRATRCSRSSTSPRSAAAGPGGRRAGGGGQHLRHPAAAAPAGPRRRLRRAQRDQVHRRPLRPAARRGGVPPRRATARGYRRREVAGATPGALETFLALRGARTLAVRLRQGQRDRRRARPPARGAPRGRPGALPRACPTTRTTTAPPGRCAASARCCPSSSPTPPPPTPSARGAGHRLRHQPRRGRVHHRAPGEAARPGARPGRPAAPERRLRTRRGPVGRPHRRPRGPAGAAPAEPASVRAATPGATRDRHRTAHRRPRPARWPAGSPPAWRRSPRCR